MTTINSLREQVPTDVIETLGIYRGIITSTESTLTLPTPASQRIPTDGKLVITEQNDGNLSFIHSTELNGVRYVYVEQHLVPPEDGVKTLRHIVHQIT